jgi:hypothetical protein
VISSPGIKNTPDSGSVSFSGIPVNTIIRAICPPKEKIPQLLAGLEKYVLYATK